MRPLNTRRKRPTMVDARKYLAEGVYCSVDPKDNLTDAEREQVLSEVVEQLLNVTKGRFPRTGILDYAILKAHLIVEYAVTQYIRCSSYVLVDTDALRLTFAQKLDVSVLLGFGIGSPTTIPSVEMLNRIRNQAAHRFVVDRSLVDELIRINSDPEEFDPATVSDRYRISFLRWLCGRICGGVAGRLEALVYVTGNEGPKRMMKGGR